MAFVFALASALAAVLPATAQVSSGAGAQAIVVQGFRDPKRRASDYVDRILPPVFDAQIGQFEDPLCPTVVGLPENLKSEVLSRVRQVAAAAKIPVSSGKCAQI